MQFGVHRGPGTNPPRIQEMTGHRIIYSQPALLKEELVNARAAIHKFNSLYLAKKQ